jgi:SAM-dependent methyltransferase
MLDEVLDFYRAKLAEHGPTALGVGWPGEDRQIVMFDQLLKICSSPRSGARDTHFSLLDYGCGYGALLQHLLTNSWTFDRYVGFDLLPEMASAGKQLFRNHQRIAEFTADSGSLSPVDYVVCSGMLNVKQNADQSAWQVHVLQLLDRMWSFAKKGMAFNSLTTYSEPGKMRGDLFYADPCFLFDYCKRNFSRHVALLHDYGLWEFTILVRRDDVAR